MDRYFMLGANDKAELRNTSHSLVVAMISIMLFVPTFVSFDERASLLLKLKVVNWLPVVLLSFWALLYLFNLAHDWEEFYARLSALGFGYILGVLILVMLLSYQFNYHPIPIWTLPIGAIPFCYYIYGFMCPVWKGEKS